MSAEIILLGILHAVLGVIAKAKAAKAVGLERLVTRLLEEEMVTDDMAPITSYENVFQVLEAMVLDRKLRCPAGKRPFFMWSFTYRILVLIYIDTYL